MYGSSNQDNRLMKARPIPLILTFSLREKEHAFTVSVLSQQRLGAGARETGRDLRHAVGVVAAIAAQAAVAVVVGDDIGDRPIALGLHDQPALELQVGADQGGQGAGFAEQIGDRVRVIVAGQDLVDGAAQARQAAAHGRTLYREGGDGVVGQGRGFLGFHDHRAHMGRRRGLRNPAPAAPIRWRRSTRPAPISAHGCGFPLRPRPATARRRARRR